MVLHTFVEVCGKKEETILICRTYSIEVKLGVAGLQSRNIEFAVIRISILIAFLIIGIGVALRLLENNQSSPQVQGGSPVSQASGSDKGAKPETSKQPEESHPPLLKGKVVAIGDSYTYGYPYGMEASWVKAAGDNLGQEFINKGKQSQTSADLLARFKADVLSTSPQTVIILAGAGDALRGVSLPSYQRNIQEMVGLARTQNITIILGLPVSSADPNVRKLGGSYRDWLSGYAQAEKLTLIDFDAVLFDEKGNYKAGNSDDGKYPSRQGYQSMAQAVGKLFQQ